MIARTWSAKLSPERESEYLKRVETVVLPRLRKVQGYKGSHFLRISGNRQHKILVVTYWESMESVKSLTGGDPGKAYVPSEIADTLDEFDLEAEHYDVVIDDHLPIN